MKGDSVFLGLLDTLRDLHIAKSAGYSGVDNDDAWANFRQAHNFGVSPFLGCLIRMSDKFIRVQNLAKNPANDQVNEAIEDTLLDLASYALISICLFQEKKDDNQIVGPKR